MGIRVRACPDLAITGTKMTDSGMLAPDRLLRAIVDSATDYAIIATDREGRILTWNSGAESILGWSAAEAIGNQLAMIFTPEDRAAGVPDAEFETARRNNSANDERYHVRRDGERFWAQGRLMLLRDTDTEEFDGYLKILRDHSGEKQRAADASRLRETEARLQLALEAAEVVGTWSWSFAENRTVADERFVELFGLPAAAAQTGIVPEEFQRTIHEDDRERVSREFFQAVEAAAPFVSEYRIRRSDGSIRWVYARGRPQLDAEGKPVRLLGAAVDITDRRLAEAELRASESRLRLAIEAGHMAVWLVRTGTSEIEASPELRRILDFPPDEDLTVEKVNARYPPGELERLQEAGAAALRGGSRYFQEEFQYRWRDGSLRWLMLRAEVLFEEQQPTGAIGVVLDITERRQSEERLRLLVEELNHRVKNSLASVQAMASQTLRSSASLEEARTALTARILAMARAHDVLTATHWESADLKSILYQSTSAHLGPDGARIEFEGDNVSLPPRAALAMSMAFHELATNASKYGALSVAQGRVSVTAKAQGRGRETRFTVRWEELSGPPVAPRSRQGFGTRLLERSLSAELNGTVELEFRSGGVVCTMTASIAEP